ncbi:MAG: hypothetical protein J5714_02665 [Alphaproteobacteria bacterium]|nr:hypothetical protein [Alphaproteobacteria bacterium]
MTHQVKDNTFCLFANDKKSNDKRPDWSGKGKVSGVEVKIAIWKRKSQNGAEYLSGTIEEVAKPDMPQEEPQPEALDNHILC